MKIHELIKAKSSNVLLLWSIIFALASLLFFIFGFSGIIIAIPFVTKIMLILAFLCLFVAGALFYFKKDVKVKGDREKSK